MDVIENDVVLRDVTVLPHWRPNYRRYRVGQNIVLDRDPGYLVVDVVCANAETPGGTCDLLTLKVGDLREELGRLEEHPYLCSCCARAAQAAKEGRQ